MGVASLILAVSSLAIEGDLSSSWLASSGWIYTRDANGARQLLAMIGGSLITVTGVIFSVTLVALTNASSQLGTRILRTFARDTGNKIVLGAFLGTFLYCLLVMRTITGGSNGFVPHFSVLVGIALSMLCFALLIYFIHHVIRIVQADNVVTTLSADLDATISRVFPEEKESGDEREQIDVVPLLNGPSTTVGARKSGYLESIDYEAVLRLAVKNGATVEIVSAPGEFLVCGAVVARVRPPLAEDVARAVAHAFNIESERSYVQDLEFAFQQLVLVATRSLSPAINDQLLAMTCIDRLCEALVVLSRRQLPSRFRRDEAGVIKVIIPPLQYADIIQMALGLVSELARDSAGVSSHLLYAVGRVLDNINVPEMEHVLCTFAAELNIRASQSLTSEVDRLAVARAYQNAIVAPRKAA